MENSQVQRVSIQRVSAGVSAGLSDQVAVEEPLEIQLAYSTQTGRMQKNIAVTMRTPGNDEELALGFLFTEGIIHNKASVKDTRTVSADENRVLVTLEEGIQPVLSNVARNFYSSSSCGICGKASIDAIRISPGWKDVKDNILIAPAILHHLQEKLSSKQQVFENTGGIHASALFDLQGNFLMVREDVGRHNALDKLVGAAFTGNRLPLNDCILFLSGRASFELVQKAVMAGLKIIVAVGAPSSLAVELANETGITLAGFLRGERFNLYSGFERIQQS